MCVPFSTCLLMLTFVLNDPRCKPRELHGATFCAGTAGIKKFPEKVQFIADISGHDVNFV